MCVAQVSVWPLLCCSGESHDGGGSSEGAVRANDGAEGLAREFHEGVTHHRSAGAVPQIGNAPLTVWLSGTQRLKVFAAEPRGVFFESHCQLRCCTADDDQSVSAQNMGLVRGGGRHPWRVIADLGFGVWDLRSGEGDVRAGLQKSGACLQKKWCSFAKKWCLFAKKRCSFAKKCVCKKVVLVCKKVVLVCKKRVLVCKKVCFAEKWCSFAKKWCSFANKRVLVCKKVLQVV